MRIGERWSLTNSQCERSEATSLLDDAGQPAWEWRWYERSGCDTVSHILPGDRTHQTYPADRSPRHGRKRKRRPPQHLPDFLKGKLVVALRWRDSEDAQWTRRCGDQEPKAGRWREEAQLSDTLMRPRGRFDLMCRRVVLSRDSIAEQTAGRRRPDNRGRAVASRARGPTR